MTIPREVVAAALDVPADSLPEGDLPLDRFAARYRASLDAPESETPPEAWTHHVVHVLAQEHPALALAAIRETLALCETPETVALVAAGPLEDVLEAHGPNVIGAVEAAAEGSPRFRYALTGVWRDGINPMVWARIEAARAGGPALDAGDPVPPL